MSSGNPTAADILIDNPEADIFLLNGIVYSNAGDLDWVMEKDWTAGEEVAEITRQTAESNEFTSGTATILPVGTSIYQTEEPSGLYIAIVNNEEIPYIGLREG
ncbi:hypothetical protein [Gracilibacillus salinarum]|uniref:Uncharacterized protein n=1 Tax=Gracilibacillus salinarum TaxID=2932255 RepID=A0ABY4GRI2_9BACI|nr:hypothetical protein [Gracilibacillus salinarum]UOQ86889.1 hypothetical protein MUN87_08400 [Gracilibacillus salinarum]